MQAADPQDSGRVAAAAGPPPGAAARAFSNTVLLLGVRTGSRLLALITVFAAAAGLGADGFGRFQTAVTYMAVTSVVIDLGFNTLYMREAARRPEELGRYLRNVLSSRLVLAVVALVVLAAALQLPRLEDLLPAAFATMLLSAYGNVLRSTFYALGRLRYEAVAILGESLILLGLTLAGLRLHAPVAWYLWAYAASYAASCTYFAVVIATRRIARLGWQFEPEFLRRWLRLSLPFAATFFLTTIYFKSDVPILQQFRSYHEVGWYTFAYKPFESLLFIPTTMLNVVFPLLGVLHDASGDRLRVAVHRFYKGLFALGWPATVGVVLLAPGVNSLFDRSGAYGAAVPALRILGAGIVLMFVTMAFVAALNATERQHLITWSSLAALALNIALNFALIPAYGYLGAAAATDLTELGLLAIVWVLVARSLGPVPLLALSWRLGLAGLLMALPLWFFRDLTGPSVLIAILVGMAVYAGAALLLRAFPPEELALARRALLRRGA